MRTMRSRRVCKAGNPMRFGGLRRGFPEEVTFELRIERYKIEEIPVVVKMIPNTGADVC